MRTNVLVAEDDISISNMLCELLSQNGYTAVPVFDGAAVVSCFSAQRLDLVLLDLMLPKMSGPEVLQEIRKISNVPVIALTAVESKAMVVKLLEAGANDYVTKPFDNRELIARIGVWLKKETVHKANGIVLSEKDFSATLGGVELGLSRTEFEVLRLFVANPKKVFTKNNIYMNVWKSEYLGDDNTVNVHISKLRTKLAKIDPNTEYIETVWGIGFKLKGQ